MSNKKQKQCTTMEQHHGEDFLDDIDYEVSSVLLDLSNFVDFSSDSSTSLPKWGLTRKRIISGSLKPQEISPVTKPPLVCTEVKELGSTSSSSCLTGEAKKTNPQTISAEAHFSTEDNWLEMHMNSSQPNSFLEPEMSLAGAQVALRDDQNLEPLICVNQTVNARAIEAELKQAWDNLQRSSLDLNFPAPEEGCENNGIVTSESLQRAETKAQAAHARQRRLVLMRSKKFYKNMFISPYQ